MPTSKAEFTNTWGLKIQEGLQQNVALIVDYLYKINSINIRQQFMS